MTRRSASLRQTRTAQASLEIPPAAGVRSGSGSSMVGGHPASVASAHSVGGASVPTHHGPAKKSNWEVIEHFSSSGRGRGSVSSSLIAVRKTFHSKIILERIVFCGFRFQVGVTRFNVDDTMSNVSGSTCNSPMGHQRDQTPFYNHSEFYILFSYFILSISHSEQFDRPSICGAHNDAIYTSPNPHFI